MTEFIALILDLGFLGLTLKPSDGGRFTQVPGIWASRKPLLFQQRSQKRVRDSFSSSVSAKLGIGGKATILFVWRSLSFKVASARGLLSQLKAVIDASTAVNYPSTSMGVGCIAQVANQCTAQFLGSRAALIVVAMKLQRLIPVLIQSFSHGRAFIVSQ